MIFLSRSHWVWFLVDALGLWNLVASSYCNDHGGNTGGFEVHGCVSAWVEFSNMGGPGSR